MIARPQRQFQFDLCLALGYPHPDYLLQDLTGVQLSEWEAYNVVQPIGGKRLDFYFAYTMMTLHNLAVSIHGKSGAKQFKLEDFIPKWAGAEETQENVMSADDIKSFFVDFNEQLDKKGSIKKKKQ